MAIREKWDEWSLKVLEEIARINNEQTKINRDIEELKKTIINSLENNDDKSAEKYKNLTELLEKLDVILTGDDKPEKGMIVRLDRIEEKEKGREWIFRTSLAASITSIVGLALTWIFKLIQLP